MAEVINTEGLGLCGAVVDCALSRFDAVSAGDSIGVAYALTETSLCATGALNVMKLGVLGSEGVQEHVEVVVISLETLWADRRRTLWGCSLLPVAAIVIRPEYEKLATVLGFTRIGTCVRIRPVVPEAFIR